MFNLVQKRRWFYLFSGIIILIGIVLMGYSVIERGTPFHLSIDFEGGAIYEVQFTGPGATEANIREVFNRFGDDNPIIQQIGSADQYKWDVRTQQAFTDATTSQQILQALGQLAPLDPANRTVEHVSAVVAREVTRAAAFAVLVGTVVVTGFIVFAFRSVPDAFRYGVCAIIAMFHDVLVVSAAMSLFGIVLGWEVDSLFLTAVLMVVGFSVQDTIVLYDRIRENIPKYLGEPYETIVNRSILETVHRSLTTQLCVFFIMVALIAFGGESIRQFVAILFVGLLTGAYSTIFIAVPLLVSWEKGEIPFISRREITATAEAEA
jgi:preprotein translocase SecF subunit